MIAVWVLRNRRNPPAQIIPLALLVVMNCWALLVNLRDFLREQDWLLLVLDVIIFALAVRLIVEAIFALPKPPGSRPAGPRPASDEGCAEGVGRISLGSTQWRPPPLLHNR